MINVRGAVLKLAHCLTRRAHGVSERLPACRNFVVCLVAMAQLCMFCPPSSLSFPLLFPPPHPLSPSLLSPTGYSGCGDEPPVPLH